MLCQNYMMFLLVLYPPPILRLNIAYFAVAEGWLLLDIRWFVLFFYLIARGFHRTLSTGAACQQWTLTPPDTWSCPTLGLASVLMLRPISLELVLFPDFWVWNIHRYFCFCFMSNEFTYFFSLDSMSSLNVLQIKFKIPLKLYCGYLYTRPCMINCIWGLKQLWLQVNGHAWFHLHEIHWAVRNRMGLKNSKWKYVSLAGFEPTHSAPRPVIQHLRPLGHAG